MTIAARCAGSFVSGTLRIAREITRKITQIIKIISRVPISLKRFSQVIKLLTQLIKESVLLKRTSFAALLAAVPIVVNVSLIIRM